MWQLTQNLKDLHEQGYFLNIFKTTADKCYSLNNEFVDHLTWQYLSYFDIKDKQA